MAPGSHDSWVEMVTSAERLRTPVVLESQSSVVRETSLPNQGRGGLQDIQMWSGVT